MQILDLLGMYFDAAIVLFVTLHFYSDLIWGVLGKVQTILTWTVFKPVSELQIFGLGPSPDHSSFKRHGAFCQTEIELLLT